MMRTLLTAGTLAFLWAGSPASAMMCGGGQQAQSSGNSVASAMMCGSGTAAQDDPMADKPSQKQQQSGMCPCCRNMAMMDRSMPRHGMPGMEAPKQ
jgi:hypothetical protein